MKNLILIVIGTLLLSSCMPYRKLTINGDPVYTALMYQFIDDGEKYGDYTIDLGGQAEKTSISMVAEYLGPYRVAQCVRKSGPAIVEVGVVFSDEIIIKVNKDLWTTMDTNLREASFYHEMGHCFLNLGHDDRLAVVGGQTIRKTLMNRYAFATGAEYAANRDYYLSELFKAHGKYTSSSTTYDSATDKTTYPSYVPESSRLH